MAPDLPAEQRRELLGPLRQVGYVVDDVEVAARDWVDRFGVGPWRVKHGLVIDGCRYRGEEIDLELSIASAYSGGLELELIGPHGDTESMYRDFVRAGGPGVQHVCFFPRNYDAAMTGLLGDGMELVLHGAIHGTRFAYLGDGKGQVVEIADVSAEGLEVRARLAEARWDGSEPIRVS